VLLLDCLYILSFNEYRTKLRTMVKYCTEAALSKICQLHRFIDFIWCFRYAGARTVATIVKKLNYHYFLTCKCKHHI